MIAKIKALVGRVFAALFFRLITEKGRRMFYLTSLYFYLSQYGIFEKMSLSEFKSKGLGLPELNTNSLNLPMISKDIIWEATGVRQAVKQELLHCPISGCVPMDVAAKTATEIMRNTPFWLRYEIGAMRRDTVRLCYIAQL